MKYNFAKTGFRGIIYINFILMVLKYTAIH